MFSKCFVTFLFCAFSHVALAQGTTQPYVLPAKISDVFIPLGFDDNDNVELIIHGHFPNSCYRTGAAIAQVDDESKEITIQAKSYFYANAEECVEMTNPFTQSIRLGTLTAGSYKIVVQNDSSTYPNLEVAHSAVLAPDEYLYAPVDFVNLVPTQDGPHSYMMSVAGNLPKLPDGCLRIKELKTHFSPANVLIVLPIMQKLSQEECRSGGFAPQDSSRFELNKSIQFENPGHYLIHVRSISGESRNLVFERY